MSQPATPRTSPGVLRELFILLKPFRLIVSLSIVLGMIGGLSVTVLLATINSALHADSGLTQQVVALFAGLCVLALISLWQLLRKYQTAPVKRLRDKY